MRPADSPPVRPGRAGDASPPSRHALARPAAAPPPVHRATVAMGTFLHVELYGPSPSDAHRVTDRAFMLARRLSRQLSRFEPGGEVGRLNAWPAHHPFEVSLRLRRLLSKALAIWRASDGAFSPAPLSASLRGPAIRLCDRHVIREDPDAQIDLGAIAKGYILDEMVALLRRSGITGGIVNAGGDIRAFGDRTWTLHLRHPHRPDETLGAVRLRNAALCASGQTFQPGHLRDPRRAGLTHGASAAGTAVIARSAADADAWATALCVAGHQGLRRWFPRRAISGLVIESSGAHSLRLWRTKSFPMEIDRADSVVH